MSIFRSFIMALSLIYSLDCVAADDLNEPAAAESSSLGDEAVPTESTGDALQSGHAWIKYPYLRSGSMLTGMSRQWMLEYALDTKVSPFGRANSSLSGNAVPAVPSDAAADKAWDSLKRISHNTTVSVDLRNGSKFEGIIQEVGPEGLGFSKSVVKVRRDDIKEFVGKLEKEEKVELRLHNGKVLAGTVQDISDLSRSLAIVETGSTIQIKREDIRKIHQGSRSKSALAGLAVGALVGVLVGASSPSHDLSRGAMVGMGTVVFGGIGAGIGAAAGHSKTFYESPAPPRAAGAP